ncbi:cupin domain-containing protein [Plantactinospora siamensis]|uniref:Cupin domain-containing protein n=1 Tax=Plantactinospora siamensis TaxID=555372 RepID=A0ABV6P6C0_9ACTN
MTSFASFGPPVDGAPGYRVVAGPGQALDRLLLVAGRLVAAEEGPVHLHRGEEILHVLSGRLLVRIGDLRRECGPGEVVAVPADTWHGYRALTDTVLEVVAEQHIGTVFPVGGGQLEVYRADMPWGRTPPTGQPWTSDTEISEILASLDRTV